MNFIHAFGHYTAALALLSTAATAQQFQYQVGMIPGTPRWTEGLETADVDNDGDLDIFFAEGDGYTSPGPQRQNVLVINQLVESGSLAFTEESLARLGAHVSIAKGVATGDINGDGYVDAVFANAFNTDRTFLYLNKGTVLPGFFDEEGNTRGLSEVLSSAGAGLADLDNDGDLDLILNDVGDNFLFGTGDRPNLYINDGAGNFTEKAGPGWNPPIKRAQMDVQLVDVDNDWDLDFVGYCVSANTGGNHYLMLNDGNANFTDASASLPNGSVNCYETEVGDLDGDSDIDLFMVSLSGFSEGAIKNNLVESGNDTLSFTAQPALAFSQDDNEIALCDYDNDGDLDSFVGSLGTKERLWRNDGGMVFSGDHSAIQTVGDATLDCTFADLNNDGTYDLITSQGEGQTSNWVNKVYLNSGPVDTLSPTITGIDPVGSIAMGVGTWVARAKMQDAVVDDGINHVTGKAHYVVVDNLVSPTVSINAGNFSPANLNVAAGTFVIFENASGSNQSVTSTSAPWTYDSSTLSNGQSYQVGFIRPGVYTYTSTLGGFNGTVTVSGSADMVAGTHSGGGLYRFAMSGDASAPGAILAYELEFTDWAGNDSVSLATFSAQSGPVGQGYCFGTGGGTACPCGNAGSAGNGCANSAGAAGANLAGAGAATVGADSVVLLASGCAGNRPGLFFQGDIAIAGGNGVTFGDGLLCAGSNIQRLQIVSTDAVGDASSSVVISPSGGVNAGETKTYQYWFRDPSGAPCGNGFNTTNGLEIMWN